MRIDRSCEAAPITRGDCGALSFPITSPFFSILLVYLFVSSHYFLFIVMAELQGRKVFKVFNQDFIVNENYNVTKELGQGAYGIVW